MKPDDNFIPFIGFAPDADPTQPGVLTDTTMMLATQAGLESYPDINRLDGASAFGHSAPNFSAYPAGWVQGAIATPDYDPGYVDVLAQARSNSTTTLYALRQNGSTATYNGYKNWENVTPADLTAGNAGGGYYVFDRLGTDVLACGGGPVSGSPSALVRMSMAAAGNKFAVVTAAPRATIVVCASRFAMLLNTSNYVDEWYCSARDNATDWTLAPATLCASGRLVEIDGPITAGIAYGDDVLVFKARGFYLGRFTGSAEVWDFEKQPFASGCVGPHAVDKDRLGRVFWMSQDDVLMYDGATITSIADGKVRKWLRDITNFTSSYLVNGQVVYDPTRNSVWCVFNSTNGNNDNLVLSCNLDSGRWAKATTTDEYFLRAPVGYNGRALAGYPDIERMCAFRPQGAHPHDASAVRYLSALTGLATAGGTLCSVTTGDLGDDYYESELKTLRVRDIRGNITTNQRFARAYHRALLTESLTAGPTTTAKADGAFDLRQSDKWHRVTVEYSGYAECTGMNIEIVKQGAR